MAANSLIVDPSALDSLRSILVDEDATAYTYTTNRLMLALRDNRDTVLYRNPLTQAGSFLAYPYLFYGRGRTPLNKSNTVEAHLQPEPGLRSFQALRYCRHWDSLQPITVYKNGVVQTLTTDYTVDYPEGRVTFVADVQDYEPVCASFCYYKIYHAARDVLMSSIGGGSGNLVSIKLGNDQFTSAPVREQIQAIDMLIANMAPRSIQRLSKVY